MGLMERETFVGRCRVLQESVEALMCHLHHLQDQCLAAVSTNSAPSRDRPVCLNHPDYLKNKKRFDSNFPNTPDLGKAQNFGVSAGQAAQQLDPVYRIFEEVAVTIEAAMACLREIGGCSSGVPCTFKLGHNDLLMTAVMDLLVGCCRLHVVAGSVSEAKAVLGYYFSVYRTAYGEVEPSWGAVIRVIQRCSDPIKFMSQELSGKDSDALGMTVVTALLAVRDSLVLGSNVSSLMQRGVFSVLKQGDAMALPTRDGLTAGSATGEPPFLHTELRQYQSYCEWVLWSGLLLPHRVFPVCELFECFRGLCAGCFALTCHRNVTLNVHTELEKLVQYFPPKNFSQDLPLPKGVKLKGWAKELAKEAAEHASLSRFKRRAYLRSQLHDLTQLLEMTPGLVGPKLPLILAALKMARDEVCWFLVHFHLHGKKKHNFFDDSLLSTLIGEIVDLKAAVKKYSSVAQRYYTEYLQGAHRSALSTTLGALLANPGIVRSLGQELADRIKGLPQRLEQLQLKEFRWDWERLVSSLSDPSVLNKTEVGAFMRRAGLMAVQTNWVDRLDQELDRIAGLGQAWWYWDVLQPHFADCLRSEQMGDGISSEFSSSYLSLLSDAMDNVHPDCPAEQLIIGPASAHAAEAVAAAIAKRCVALAEEVCQIHAVFNARTLPPEAANRYKRLHNALSAKKRGSQPPPAAEPLPGYESSGWPHPETDKLGLYQRNLMGLLSGASKLKDGVTVWDRLLVLPSFISESFVDFFRSFLYRSTIFEHGVERPSIALGKVTTCCSVLQQVAGGDGGRRVNFHAIVRKVLLEEYTLFATQNSSRENILTRVGHWYLDLLTHISPGGKYTGFVYVEKRQGFCATTYTPKGTLPADLFLDKQEFTSLAMMLGVIEQPLLERLAAKVRGIKGLLTENHKALGQLRNTYPLDSWEESLRTIPAVALGQLVIYSVAIGNALAMRALIRSALADVYATTMPFVQDTLRLSMGALQSVASQAGNKRVTRNLALLLSLTEDVGVQGLKGLDHGLAAALEGAVDTDNLGVWELLPMALAASFASEPWKQAVFLPECDGFLGNEHTMVFTILSLFELLFPEKSDRQAKLREYIDAGSSLVLKMKVQAGSKFSSSPAIIFLERLVRTSKDVDSEDLPPQPLIHAAFLEATANRVS